MICHSFPAVAKAVTSLLVTASLAIAADVPATPVSPDGTVRISLFATNPDIVTPIGAAVDSQGRLLVIESNSHFRPKNYSGPATDRILMLQSTSANDRADHITSFYEGTNLMMNLVAQPDGSVVVSSRNEIFRLTDPQHSGKAKQKITLAHLQTTADYPHNGLSGLAVDPRGNIYFGIGENLGAPWTLVGSDGRSIHEDKGTGSIFQMDSHGKGLVRLARGLWNPFGLGVDPSGMLWAVDNDPDGRPPSRLLQIVPGGDYGFEFRYGRTGLHPLQCWDGELPGTLGMTSGVGEAPCNVRWHAGHLLVSSWRDHQIESYTLVPRGATYRATMQPLVTGGPDFRPVGMAFAPDGTLYVTDWGSASYEINGIGHLWKITFVHPLETSTPVPRDSATDRAQSLRKSTNVQELTAALADPDPFIAQAAQFGLSQLSEVEKIELSSLTSPQQRVGLLAALLWRGVDASRLVPVALGDPDVQVREMGVRVVTEQGVKSARAQLEKMLDSPVMSPRLLGMIVAAISQLDGDPAASVNSAKVDKLLLSKLDSPDTADAAKAMLLRMLPAERGAISVEELKKLLASESPAVQLEAVRSLSEMSDPMRLPLLRHTAESDRYGTALRTEAILGLGSDPAGSIDLLMKLAESDAKGLREEALRSLRGLVGRFDDAQKHQLEQITGQHPEESDMIGRLLGRPPGNRPSEDDIAAWSRILDRGSGDPEAGRRVFFHPSGPACYRCHVIDGRGHAVGPDLTMIGHSQQRQHILESILQPSREIAPLYTNWTITLRSGQRVEGMLLRRDGQPNEVYVDASGKETRVAEPDVVDRKIRKESIMPAGLVQAMTDQEMRDLMALLTHKR